MSTGLALQQRQLADAIRSASAAPPDDLLQAAPPDGAARWRIYADAYRIRLGEALKENYPILARVLGDDDFAGLAAAFLHAYPSRHPSIRWFGSELASFVESDIDTVPHPALLDLIRMEWALSTAFDGANAEPLRVADLLTLPPESWAGLSFDPHPTVQLLTLHWNVEPLWSALSADDQADTEPPEELLHYLLVWRNGQQTRWRSVAATEAGLLNAAISGQSFAQLCAAAGSHDEQRAAHTVAGYLRVWVEAGLLCNMRVQNTYAP